MLAIRMDLVLASIWLLGFLFYPLSGISAESNKGAGDEGLDNEVTDAAPSSNNMRPLYWSCVNGACAPTTESGRAGDGGILLGYIKESTESGTAPLYWACAYRIHLGGCGRQALMAQPRHDDSLLLGYIQMEPQPGTVPLYWICKQRDAFGECVELAPDNRGGAAGDSRLLGYVYPTGRTAPIKPD